MNLDQILKLFHDYFYAFHSAVNGTGDVDSYLKYIAIDIDTMIEIIKVLLFISIITIILILIFKIQVEATARDLIAKSHAYKAMIKILLKEKDYNLNKIKTPKNKLEHFALATVLIYFLRKKENNEFLYKILEEKGVLNYLKKVSSNYISYSRYEAIEKLGLLRFEKNKTFLFKIIVNSTNKKSIEHAMIGISYIIERKDLPYILGELVKLKGSGKFFEFIFSNLIERMILLNESEGVKDILYYLFEVRNNEKYLKPFIDAVAYQKVNDCSDEFYDLYFMAQSLDLKITTVRAIGALNITEKSDETLMFALSSKKDILRIAASKNLNLFNFSRYRNRIEETLVDQNYNVRLNTALSIAKSEEGFSILQEIYESSEDIYAKEMAKYAIVVNSRKEKNLPILRNFEKEEELDKELKVLLNEENISEDII